MFATETKIRVRYGETDQMGYVYYGNYPLYYEVGRGDMIRKLGWSYSKMEEEGIINSRVTVLDNKKINLNIVVFLSVSVSSHSEEWLVDFNATLSKYTQVTEAYRLTGSTTDYLLKIVAPSIEEYDKFQQELIKEIKFTKLSSSIALKEIKKIHSLPLDHI